MRRSCLMLMTTRALAALLLLAVALFSGPTRGERIAMHALSHLDAPSGLGAA